MTTTPPPPQDDPTPPKPETEDPAHTPAEEPPETEPPAPPVEPEPTPAPVEEPVVETEASAPAGEPQAHIEEPAPLPVAEQVSPLNAEPEPIEAEPSIAVEEPPPPEPEPAAEEIAAQLLAEAESTVAAEPLVEDASSAQAEQDDVTPTASEPRPAAIEELAAPAQVEEVIEAPEPAAPIAPIEAPAPIEPEPAPPVEEAPVVAASPLQPEPPAPPPPEPPPPQDVSAPPPPPPAAPASAAPQSNRALLIGGAVALIALLAVALWYYLSNRAPGDPLLPVQTDVAETLPDEDWPGLSDIDRLGVRPISMPRPVMNVAMQTAVLSAYADVEFTVGADGKATDISVVRESVEDMGYAQEARRMVTGGTWPTEWRGRTAPYPARFRVIFPPGRNAGRAIAPLAIASPLLTPEILALRRNATVTLLVRIAPDGSVESARILDADVQNDAVNAEAMRVAMGARYPENPAGFAYETQLTVHFDVVGATSPASDVPPGPVVSLSEVPFAQRPSASDFSRNYPRRALSAGVSGRVVLSCIVQRSYRLECRVTEEDPSGEGFAQAAQRIARRFRAERQFPDGRTTVGAQVTVPMVFRAD